MTHVWPDVPAAASLGRKVRDQLDYIVWITEVMEPAGFHAGADQDEWRRRVQAAYTALVDAMAPGHGDPFPPDVPPAVRPGTWPDVPSSAVPGMTVRHQLAAVRAVATTSRGNRQFPHQPNDVASWASRVQAAFGALDHGPALAMPDAARSTPPPPASTARTGSAARSVRAKGARSTARARTSTASKKPVAKRTSASKAAPSRRAKSKRRRRG